MINNDSYKNWEIAKEKHPVRKWTVSTIATLHGFQTGPIIIPEDLHHGNILYISHLCSSCIPLKVQFPLSTVVL